MTREQCKLKILKYNQESEDFKSKWNYYTLVTQTQNKSDFEGFS